MIKVQLLILLATLSITLSAFGADWSVGWTGADEKNEHQKITDEQEFQFMMAKFHCKVSKIVLDKVYNEIFERRYLSCSISKDTAVSVDLSYNVRSKDYADSRSLVIYNKDKTLVATLIVIQKRE
jgi:3'-phosphoadenosine 5'-phosphosulfate sulfotransferase (PAPS reductase)/FAD synthetase